jgi:hypothetical protein
MTIDLITRKEWGARYADGFRDRPMPFSEFWLHHSVTIAPDLVAPFDDDYAAVRTLENIGQSRFGGGISYNQPVTPAGLVFVGVSPHRQGAHTYMHNTAGFAFVLVGDYTSRPPTAAQEEAVARRMVELRRQGLATRHTLNGGHRDASSNSTSCPGNAAHARIPAINARAEELWAAGYGVPGGTPGTSVPTPKPPTSTSLTVDGYLGPNTIRAWQRIMGTPVDGVISRPSLLVSAVQRRLNAAGARDRNGRALVVDGLGIGSNQRGRYPSSGSYHTLEALQRYLGTPVDGFLSSPSSAVKALQRRLNTGKF